MHYRSRAMRRASSGLQDPAPIADRCRALPAAPPALGKDTSVRLVDLAAELAGEYGDDYQQTLPFIEALAVEAMPLGTPDGPAPAAVDQDTAAVVRRAYAQMVDFAEECDPPQPGPDGVLVWPHQPVS